MMKTNKQATLMTTYKTSEHDQGMPQSQTNPEHNEVETQNTNHRSTQGTAR